MNERLGPLAPELALTAGAVLGLLAGAWLPRRRQWIVRLMAIGACLAGLAATGVGLARPATLDFGTAYAVDAATGVVRLAVLAGTLLVVCLATPAVAGHPRESEFYVLLQLAALGTVCLAGANDLLLLFAAYLLASVPGYALAGFLADPAGTEAALKYYLMGALLGVTMLAGVTLVYGAGRSTGYQVLPAALAAAPHGVVAAGLVTVLAGLLFKAGGVPAHFWLPDVAEGASSPVAAFLTTVPKTGALVAMFRLVGVVFARSGVDAPLLLAVLAAASMTLANLAAFFQTSAARLLAYSAVSQVGYLLMAVAVATGSGLAQRSLLYYLLAYAATNLGAFAVVVALPRARTLSDYRGLARRHPALAAVLVVCLLGLLGTPPTSVFLGKLHVFAAAVDGGYAWLAALAVANTVASLFYYLRWITPVFLGATYDGRADVLAPAGVWARGGAYAAGVASLVLGVAGGVVLPIASGGLAG